VKVKRFNLTTKFIFIALGIGILFLGITAYFSHYLISREFEKHYEEKALLVAKHIISDLEEGMIRRVHQRLTDALEEYRGKEAADVRLFNSAGKEVLGSESPKLEPKVGEVLQGEGFVHFDERKDGKEVATYILPIRSKPECLACHVKKEKHLGALLISLPLDKMKASLRDVNQRHFLLFMLMVAAIVGTTFLAADRILIRPIRGLQEGARAMEAGDLSYRVPERPGDEFGDLTTGFNAMASRVQALFGEVERKNQDLMAQQALLLREKSEWQETFDAIADPVCVLDPDLSIRKANRAFREFFSLVREGSIPVRFEDLLPLFSSERGSLRDKVQEPKPFRQEYHVPGTAKILQVSSFPYFSSAGEFSGSVQILKDVTERKEKEMQLIMSERLAALGQMASGISHEILNPLATVGACAEGLLSRLDKGQTDPELFRNYLKIVEEEVQRCKQITRSMLSFVRPRGNTGNKKEVDLVSVLENSLEMVSFQGRLKNIAISRAYENKPLILTGDENDFRQIFLSVIVNALDAMEDRGALTLEAGRNDKGIFVSISDTGPGIPGAVLPRVFDPFFTTKADKGGIGLGLSIANRILRDYGGEFAVETKAGKGSAFTMIVPVDPLRSGISPVESGKMPDSL
jgi:two-component system, NtrC family, sensor kinase